MLHKRFFYPAIFIIVITFYCLYIACNGYEEWDSGFISGLAWRIVNGEVMYRDFIYTKPPLSPYLDSIFMYLLPEKGQFYYIRCINLLLFAAQVLLTVFAVDKIYGLKKYRLNPWAIAITGFIVSWLNFSPYPWYTQDGLLFASAALFFKAKYKNPTLPQLFVIALGVFLSALSKQSFYLLPPLFAIWFFIDYGFKKTLWFSIALASLLLAFLAIISQMTTFSNFMGHIMGQTHLYDLYYTCVYGYLHKNIKLYTFIGTITILIAVNYKNPKETNFKNILKWFVIIQIVSAILLLAAKQAGLGSIIAFNGCATALCYNYFVLKKTIKELFPVFVLLVIAWSASVSWGYPYPILFATGLVLAYIVLMEDTVLKYPKVHTVAAIVICMLAFAYNKYPYRQSDVSQLNYNLGDVSPKLEHIRTDKETYSKFSELKSLVEKYGPVYSVTTNYSGAHYLFNTKNPLSADWMINSEINFELERMLKEAAKGKGYIFLEKKFNPNFNRDELYKKEFSYFSQYIKDNCTPVKEFKYFTVYDTKELNEKLH